MITISIKYISEDLLFLKFFFTMAAVRHIKLTASSYINMLVKKIVILYVINFVILQKTCYVTGNVATKTQSGIQRKHLSFTLIHSQEDTKNTKERSK